MIASIMFAHTGRIEVSERSYTLIPTWVAILLLFFAQTAMSDDDPLRLIDALQKASVVIVGWNHSYPNSIVPSLLTTRLEAFDQEDVVLALELTPTTLINPFVSNNLGPSFWKMVKSAYDYKIKTAAIDTEGSVGVRDEQMAAKILKIVNKGHKVVLLIGQGHLVTLPKVLASMGIASELRDTDYNYKTGAVSFEGKVIGHAEDFFSYMTRIARFQKDWTNPDWRLHLSPDFLCRNVLSEAARFHFELP